MRKRMSLWIILLALLLPLASCGPADDSWAAELAFEAPMNVDSGERFHVSLGVHNRGQARFRDYGAFNGAMDLRDESGAEVGRVRVTTLWELAPGDSGWPAAWAAKLPAGAYQLTWGAPGHGSVTVDFTIVEMEGRLYLGEERIQTIPATAWSETREYGAVQSLVDLARVNLAQRLGVDAESVTVESITETEFPDTSLGVPEPDQMYAQVLTPGYVIELSVGEKTYEYHASDSRLAFASSGGGAPRGDITIEGVRVTAGGAIEVYGRSTLAAGSCLGSELWADGESQAWWPGETCVPVEDGAWRMEVALGVGEVPAKLDPAAQYMVRVFQQNGPNIVSVFAFDLAGPPTPQPQ